MLLRKPRYIFLILFAIFINCVVYADAKKDKTLTTKQLQEARLEQALEAEKASDYIEAIEKYCDILSDEPDNNSVSLKIAKAYFKLNNKFQALRHITNIDLEKITSEEKTEVLLLKANIEIAKGSIQDAVTTLKQAIKLNPENNAAQIDYAALNYLNGLKQSSKNILNDYLPKSKSLPIRSYITAYLLDMKFGEITRAYSSLEHISKAIEKNLEYEADICGEFLKIQPLLFMTILPISLNIYFSIFYFAFLSCCLGFLITYLTNGKRCHIAVFSFIYTATAILAQHFCFDRMLISSMQLNFSIQYSYWIIPKLLIATHFITYVSFALLPLFKFLPEKAKPRDTELYGTIFYSVCFMIFICAFHSRITPACRSTMMIFGLFFSILSSMTVPMGRFVFYQLMNSLGYKSIKEALTQTNVNASELDYSTAKKIQKKSEKFIKEEKISDLISIASNTFIYHNKATLPQLWANYILAFIINEDYENAGKNIDEYLNAFAETSHYGKGELLQAYYKCRKGDFPDSIRIIQSLSDSAIKEFTADEQAICLLVLGCCSRYQKEYVQSHIDFKKALNTATYSWLQAEALFEIAELDLSMNAKESMQKWNDKAENLHGGSIALSLAKAVCSMNCSLNQSIEEATKFSEEALSINPQSSHVLWWNGHLKIKENKYKAAEELLAKMPLGAYYKDKLIDEVTDIK